MQGCEEDPSQGLLSSSPETNQTGLETNPPDSELDYLVNLCRQNESMNLLGEFCSEHPGEDCRIPGLECMGLRYYRYTVSDHTSN